MTSTLIRRAAVLLAPAMVLVGCGGSGATPTPPPTPSPAPAIVVETSEFAFDPDALVVKAGEGALIRLVNKGVVEHDLTIDAVEFQVAVKIGGTAEGTLLIPEAGTYDFYCSLPGHKENGMVGTLTAE